MFQKLRELRGGAAVVELTIHLYYPSANHMPLRILGAMPTDAVHSRAQLHTQFFLPMRVIFPSYQHEKSCAPIRADLTALCGTEREREQQNSDNSGSQNQTPKTKQNTTGEKASGCILAYLGRP